MEQLTGQLTFPVHQLSRQLFYFAWIREEQGLAFISVSLIYPFCTKEILEAPDLFHWCWSHLVTEENTTNVMLSV
ncbi:hypothetical protein OUZ56_004554 [Daphnia magna]|uniref:Uncharacterized protein n=1 Tax=Daphnia magna TaxID=35525 RepID=A0ABQ9YQ70_9CRUS|nr:hypothetical protein OUZ56_004554 [Daphnia magna]